MNAIDKIARIRGGGAWSDEDDEKNRLSKYSFEHTVPRTEGYLLNSYDVYLKNEPCLMCGMALVHSRVRRVFFHQLSPKGALQNLAKLHTMGELNHTFEVYRMLRLKQL